MSTDVTRPDDSSVTAAEYETAVQNLIDMLHDWSEVDENDAREQSESFTELVKGIDEARKSYRTLFDGDRS